MTVAKQFSQKPPFYPRRIVCECGPSTYKCRNKGTQVLKNVDSPGRFCGGVDWGLNETGRGSHLLYMGVKTVRTGVNRGQRTTSVSHFRILQLSRSRNH